MKKNKNLNLIWHHMKGKRLLYIGAIISIGIATFFQIVNPLIVRTTIDSIIGDQAFELPAWIIRYIPDLSIESNLFRTLLVAGILIVVMTGFNGLFSYFRGKWSAIASESIAKSLRDEIYNHLQHLPYAYHVQAKTGDLIQRCTSDIEQIRMFLAHQLVEIARAVFILLLSLSVMIRLHVRLTLVAMAVVPIIIVFSYFFYGKVKKTFKDAEEAEGEMSTVLQENLTAVRVVRAFAREKHEFEKFDKKSGLFRDKGYRVLIYLAWFWSLTDLMSLGQMGAVLVVGVYWSTVGELTLGTLVAFITYEGMLLWPVRQLGRILTDLGRTQVATTRIVEVIDEQVEVEEGKALKPEITGEIKFENVSFAYEDAPILDSVSFEVKTGQTVAILGPTGSGKSTLVHLLSRLYDCQKGSIKIDGYDIKDIERKWLRKHIGLVLQEPFLFARSIKENITFANSDADEAEMIEAANNASIHDVIQEFDKGYDTLVGERGVSLSGGQKQRIAIARTIIRDCPILVFDDSLSAVDTETDARIRAALDERSKEVTTFIISHRINTLASADMILVIEEGKIVQKGDHQKLIQEEGMYKRVWQLQNEGLSDIGAV
ncbi:ABC transporter ATP-binding protein [Natronospora cellulosivora (SeqCode)]